MKLETRLERFHTNDLGLEPRIEISTEGTRNAPAQYGHALGVPTEAVRLATCARIGEDTRCTEHARHTLK